LYRDLVEQVPVVVYLATPEDLPRLLYISPHCEEVLGYGPEAWSDPSILTKVLHADDLERAFATWRRLVDAGEPFSLEHRYLHPDGRTRWLQHHARPSLDETGKPTFVRGFIADITAERRFQRDLQETEVRYRALVENIPAVIYEMGPDDERRTTFVSPHVQAVLGYSRAEWLEQPDMWIELLHPDDRENELAAHDLHNQTGEPWLRHYRLIAADGQTVWVRDQAVLVRTSDPEPPRWQGVMLDITAQKEAEDELKQARDELEFRVQARTAALADANELMGMEIEERRRAQREASRAEERLRVLVEHLPAVVYTWELGVEPEPEYTSPQIEDMLGYSAEEWNDTDLWEERLHPHDRERVLAAAERCRETGEELNIEYRYLDRSGRVVWVLDRASLIRRDGTGRPATFQGVMLPISARKAAEAKALEAEARYRMIAEGGPVIAYIWHRRFEGPQSPHSYLSPQIEQVLGYPMERWDEDVGFWRSILHPDDREWASAVEDDLERTGKPWSIDYRMIAADGNIVWLHDEGRVVERDENGEPKVLQGILLDISDRKEAEARLRESEATYRTLVEGMPAIPWTEQFDPTAGRSRLTFIGPQVEAVLGYRPEELIVEPEYFSRMLHPDDRERTLAAAVHSDRTGEPWDVLFRVIARDGTVVPLRSMGVAATDEAGSTFWHGLTFVDPSAGRPMGDATRSAAVESRPPP
jgi:PAS domain S-box-containing protein